MLHEVFVGADVQVIAQLFGLHRGHVEKIVSDLFLEVALASAWKRSNESAIWNLIDVFVDNFAQCLSTELEAHCMAALEDPRLSLVLTMLHSASAFDAEELGVKCFAEQQEVIVLQRCESQLNSVTLPIRTLK